MRNIYSLIFMASIAFPLQAQLSLNMANNNRSFYITDTNCEDSNPDDGIIWPCDFETNNCDVLSDPTVSGVPIITSNEIDQIKVTFQDSMYQNELLACNKVYRKWIVHDERSGNQNPENGTWEYIQELSLLKSAPPVFISETRNKEICVSRFDCSPDFINLRADAIDDCTAAEEIQYYYEIDLNNDGSLDFNGISNNASDVFPYGKHKIRWFAKDACENVAQCEYFFTIKDCQPPTSNCVNGLMVDLSPDKGEVTLKAEDFNQGSFDNCGLEEFRIVSPSKGEGQTSPPQADSKSVTFDCDSKGVNSVDFWVKDKSGNWDYCTTFVIVEDNNLKCEVVQKDSTLAQKLSRFVEETPFEIEKIYVPDNEIEQSEDAEFKIYPGQPNPFEDRTKISFDLKENAKMTFTIQDVSGKVIKIIEKEFLEGYNQIILKKEEFEEPGIYFFTLQSKTHQSTGKIVLIQR